MPHTCITKTILSAALGLTCLMGSGCATMIGAMTGRGLAPSTAPSSVGRTFTKYDEFTGIRREGITIKDVALRRLPISFAVGLDLVRVQEPQREDRFLVSAGIFTGKDNIMGDRIIWLADGRPIEMYGGSQLVDIDVSQFGVTCLESAAFSAKPDQLRTLADSRTLAFRIYGADGTSPRFDLGKANIQAIRRFCEDYLPRRTPRTQPTSAQADVG